MGYAREVSNPGRLILLTGATGYVGGRLLKVFQAGGYRVRCLARHPEYLQARVSPSAEVVGGDVTDKQSLKQAMQGCKQHITLCTRWGLAPGSRNWTVRPRGTSERPRARLASSELSIWAD